MKTYRELFERSADAILIIEGERFVDCNRAAIEMLRCGSREEVLSMHPSELSPPHQPDGKPSYDAANEMIAVALQRGSHRFEWYHKRADGEVFPVEVLLTAVREGEREQLHVVWRDITERKRLEEELRHVQKMEAVGKLAGGVAHDFNNLLVVILGHCDLLQDMLEDRPDAREHLSQIEHAGQRAATLVARLLAYARKQQLKPVVLDLGELVEGMRDMLRQLVGGEPNIVLRADERPVFVEADAGQLEQVLLNLASNARDALSPGGGLTIEVTTARLAEPPGDLSAGLYAQLSVTDDGVGMDERVAARAFDPFFTTKEAGKGTGLGLSTVYGIVRQSGGAVRLISEPGRGTRVDVFLPLVDALAEPRRGEEPHDEGLTLREPPGQERVLVVEDERGVGALVVQALRRAGYEVRLATDGVEALRVIEVDASPFDLVLSDVVMPNLGGVELARALRGRAGAAPRVLLMSGHVGAMSLGAEPLPLGQALLEKPFSVDELLAAVRAALEGPAWAREGPDPSPNPRVEAQEAPLG